MFKPANVDEYIMSFPADTQKKLEQLRQAVKKLAPAAEEVISYGMPAYRKNGMVGYFAGFKNHCSYFPGSYAVMKQFKEELKPYNVSKGTIQFPIDKPLSSSLLKKLVIAKIKENETKQTAKAAKKSITKKKTAKAIK